MAAELGVFCGTFNPIHWGHLLMAEFARQQLALEKVLLITSPNPPHRHFDILDSEKRFALVSEAVSKSPHFVASRLEMERSGTSYTIDTLRDLKKMFPQHNLNLIIGEDNLQYIGQWRSAAEIFQLARIVVAPRSKQLIKPTDPQTSVPVPPHARIAWLDLPHVDVSASEIRKRLREGRSVKYLVPAPVERIIKEQRFYSNEARRHS